MTFAEAEAFLKRLKYKPGTTFTLLRSPWDPAAELRIAMMAPDAAAATPSYSALKPVMCRDTIANLERMNEKDLLRFIQYALHNLERHETEEFLRLDGEHVTDPHPNLTKAALEQKGYSNEIPGTKSQAG